MTFLDNGEQLRIEDLYRTGFRAPIIIREKSGLGLEIPENITLQDVVEIIGYSIGRVGYYRPFRIVNVRLVSVIYIAFPFLSYFWPQFDSFARDFWPHDCYHSCLTSGRTIGIIPSTFLAAAFSFLPTHLPLPKA